jgi:hypothetical protein
VLPEFVWKPIYDQKHRIEEVTSLHKQMRILQKGLRERLLCPDCEQYLNDNYEKYFVDVWYEKGLAPTNMAQDCVCVSGLDYARFKLFNLSILWRAGVSTLEQFKEVSLGKHEEILRSMIQNRDPGPEHQYGILAYALTSPQTGEVCQEIVTAPTRTYFQDSHVGYDFIFGGFLWRYLVNQETARYFLRLLFKPSGKLLIIRLNIDEYKPIMSMMKNRINKGWEEEE